MKRVKNPSIYKNILFSSSFGFAYHKIILDENGYGVDCIIVDYNNAFEKIAGVTEKDVIGKRIIDVFPDLGKDNFDWISYFVDICTKSGEDFFEIYSETAVKWFKVHVYSDENFYFATTFVDITSEKIKTEQLENFFNVNLDLLCIADTNGNFIKINKEWEHTLGYDTVFFETHKFLDLVHPDDLSATLDAISKLSNQKNVLDFTNRYRCKDGSYRFIEWRSHPVGNFIYAAARDITQKIQLENDLKIQTEFQRMVTDVSYDFVSVTIQDFDIKINRLLKKIGEFFDIDRAYLFRFSEDNVFMSNTHEWCSNDIEPMIDMLQELPSDDFRWWVDIILSNNVINYEDINDFPPEAASVKEILKAQCIQSILVIPVKAVTGIIGFVGLDSVKKKKFWEDDKVKYLQMLTNVISDAYTKIEYETQLIEQKEAAEKASRVKAEFLANMSHEIRTPLNGILGFIELLKRSDLNNHQNQFVDNAITSANSLLDIINDILDFSKIEAGRLELEYLRTDIISLFDQIFDVIKIQKAKGDIEFILDVEPDIPRYAYTDPVRLKQIFINLLGNALKFTQKGEVGLKVNFVYSGENKGIYSFEISDTGIGISESQKDKLFKAFSQADTSTTRKFGGTGLGLVISGLIARKMGSELNFDSELGKGTTFYFKLETEIEDGEKINKYRVDNIKRVLIIDDNINNCNVIEKIIKSWDIECFKAHNSLSAVEAVEKNGIFDCIIVDYDIPYMNGADIIRLIREKFKNIQSFRFILIHRSSDTVDAVSACEESGVMLRLVKPVKTSELFSYLFSVGKNIEKVNITGNKTIDRKISKDVFIKKQPVILITEDVDMNTMLIKIFIKQIIPECELLYAKNGKKALEYFINRKIDLIFMDIQMPEMDGFEVTQKIRELENSKNLNRTPIIALTAGVLNNEKQKSIDVGMDYYLSKPIDFKELENVLKDFYVSIEGNFQ